MKMRERLSAFMPPGSLLVLISASVLLASGDPRTENAMGIPRSSYGLGSAKYLEGTNLLYSLYVDTPEHAWSPEAKEQTLDNLDIAAVYIEETAKEYHKEVDLVYDWQETEGLLGVASVDFAIADDEDFMDRLNQEIGVWVEETVDFEGLMQEHGAQGMALLVFVNNPGTSYAIVYDGTDNPKESIIFFAGEPPAVYAHEIFHVFGAHDLYQDAEYSQKITDYIRKAYPLEIMRTVIDGNGKRHENEIVNTVSPVTAYHLGWIDKIEEIEEFPQLKRKGD